MADKSSISYKAGDAAGHAQIKKDEMMNKASNAAESTKQTAQEGSERASGFLQETGEQVKNMAQGAAETVKNAVGMGSNNNSTTRN